jgi:hypothetical protein
MKKIRVCDCGAPLLWTFLYDGYEYFCMACGNKYGMLGAGKLVDQTKTLRAQEIVFTDVFKALRKHLLGNGRFRRKDCKKCLGEQYHTQHLTPLERERDGAAVEFIRALKNNIL